MQDLESYARANEARFEADLFELLRIASVSTDPAFQPQVEQAARWLHDRFQTMGLKSELIPTIGHPLVYAETPPIPGAPTILVYGHYDVQPPDPLDEWITPPFEPTRRDGNVYARGATDDKGQVLTHVFGVESWMKQRGGLPLQVKFLIEGEEECGSKGLNEYLQRPEAAEKLRCDVVVISDSTQYGEGQPAITYGLRGIAYFELRLSGPKQDLHSGAFGGAVANPANALTWILSQLIDREGRIQVPGFYDDVVPLTPQERKQFADLRFDDQAFKKDLGISATAGEVGYSTLERRWARPTFDINGLWSGYQGQGAKTVLPARAGAKFSFRLVPRQDQHKIERALEARIRELCPPGITYQLTNYHSAAAVSVPLESPFIAAAAEAITRGFGKQPVMIRTGGSIPIVLDFAQLLGVDSLLLGWGLDNDNPHSPNEKFCLADFHRGIRTSGHLWETLAGVKA